MPLITIDVEVYCATCGKGICHLAEDSTRSGRTPAITVEPCKDCMETEYERGRADGIDEAEAEEAT